MVTVEMVEQCLSIVIRRVSVHSKTLLRVFQGYGFSFTLSSEQRKQAHSLLKQHAGISKQVQSKRFKSPHPGNHRKSVTFSVLFKQLHPHAVVITNEHKSQCKRKPQICS